MTTPTMSHREDDKKNTLEQLHEQYEERTGQGPDESPSGRCFKLYTIQEDVAPGAEDVRNDVERERKGQATVSDQSVLEEERTKITPLGDSGIGLDDDELRQGLRVDWLNKLKVEHTQLLFDMVGCLVTYQVEKYYLLALRVLMVVFHETKPGDAQSVLNKLPGMMRNAVSIIFERIWKEGPRKVYLDYPTNGDESERVECWKQRVELYRGIEQGIKSLKVKICPQWPKELEDFPSKRTVLESFLQEKVRDSRHCDLFIEDFSFRSSRAACVFQTPKLPGQEMKFLRFVLEGIFQRQSNISIKLEASVSALRQKNTEWENLVRNWKTLINHIGTVMIEKTDGLVTMEALEPICEALEPISMLENSETEIRDYARQVIGWQSTWNKSQKELLSLKEQNARISTELKERIKSQDALQAEKDELQMKYNAGLEENERLKGSADVLNKRVASQENKIAFLKTELETVRSELRTELSKSREQTKQLIEHTSRTTKLQDKVKKMQSELFIWNEVYALTCDQEPTQEVSEGSGGRSSRALERIKILKRDSEQLGGGGVALQKHADKSREEERRRVELESQIKFLEEEITKCKAQLQVYEDQVIKNQRLIGHLDGEVPIEDPRKGMTASGHIPGETAALQDAVNKKEWTIQSQKQKEARRKTEQETIRDERDALKMVIRNLEQEVKFGKDEYGERIACLEERIVQLKKQIGDQEQKCNEATNTLSNCEKAYEAETAKFAKTTSELSQARKRVGELEGETRMLREKLAGKDIELPRMLDVLNHNKDGIMDLQASVKTRDSMIEKLSVDLKTVKSTLADIQLMLSAQQQNADEANTSSDSLQPGEDALKEDDKRFTELGNLVRDLERAITEHCANNSQEDKTGALEFEITKLKESTISLQAKVDSAQARRDDAKADTAKWVEKYETLEGRAPKAEAQNVLLEEKLKVASEGQASVSRTCKESRIDESISFLATQVSKNNETLHLFFDRYKGDVDDVKSLHSKLEALNAELRDVESKVDVFTGVLRSTRTSSLPDLVVPRTQVPEMKDEKPVAKKVTSLIEEALLKIRDLESALATKESEAEVAKLQCEMAVNKGDRIDPPSRVVVAQHSRVGTPGSGPDTTIYTPEKHAAKSQGGTRKSHVLGVPEGNTGADVHGFLTDTERFRLSVLLHQLFKIWPNGKLSSDLKTLLDAKYIPSLSDTVKDRLDSLKPAFDFESQQPQSLSEVSIYEALGGMIFENVQVFAGASLKVYAVVFETLIQPLQGLNCKNDTIHEKQTRMPALSKKKEPAKRQRRVVAPKRKDILTGKTEGDNSTIRVYEKLLN